MRSSIHTFWSSDNVDTPRPTSRQRRRNDNKCPHHGPASARLRCSGVNCGGFLSRPSTIVCRFWGRGPKVTKRWPPLGGPTAT